MNWIGMVSFATPKKAERAAKQLLQKRLIACANIIPTVHSSYWWKGRIRTGTEALLLFKTRKELVKKAVETIEALHEYEVPVIEAWGINKTNSLALKWIQKETNPRTHSVARPKKHTRAGRKKKKGRKKAFWPFR